MTAQLFAHPRFSSRFARAVIVANRPLLLNHVSLLCGRIGPGGLVICADGGANRLFDATRDVVPDYVVGDMDSVRDDVREAYGEKGVAFLKDPNENENDLRKAISLLGRLVDSSSPPSSSSSSSYSDSSSSSYSEVSTPVFVLGALGGRFDHVMSTVSELANAAVSGFPHPLIAVGDSSTVSVLPAGKHRIHVNKDIEGPVCGLIPVNGDCKGVTTEGLEWNLNDSTLTMGSFISTSNRVVDGANTVTVTTQDPILWTTEMHL